MFACLFKRRCLGLAGSILSTSIFSFCLVAGPALADDARVVPDLLELGARADVRAQNSLQLGVGRAGDRLVSVGVRGTVLLSDDGGKAWRQAKTVPVSVTLTDTHFASERLGWAVGHSGVVLHTADGGDTWVRQLDGRQAAGLVLDDARKRLTAGDATAERALRDAERLVEDGPDKPLLAVRFAGERRGYVVGAYGLALVTDDGGKSWQSLMGRIPNPRGKHLYQVQIDGDDVLIAGEQGALFHSRDGGLSFSAVSTPYAGTFFGVIALDGETWVAYGLRGNAWRTTDRGATWARVPLDQAVTLSAGRRLLNGSVLLADESGRLLLSTDRGATFRALPTPAVTGLTGIAQAADGALVLSGARGPVRIDPTQLASSQPTSETQR
jgi:photosystem II stability/assembly factor-like uncharacterized protein